MGTGLKPAIVLSAVNFTEMGPLSVFKDALASLAATHAGRYDIIAVVHRKTLFDISGITFMEYPEVKSSWLKRLRFEYYDCRAISRQIKPHLWLSMHDMTPNVQADIRAVYCHNPSPFYPFRLRDALRDWKFGLSTLFYRFLYAINIQSNDFVVVQQDWMRSKFRSLYGVKTVVVSHPSIAQLAIAPRENSQLHPPSPYVFFYPAYPRIFKNIEQILKAARLLEQRGIGGFEIWLTIDGSEKKTVAPALRSGYADLVSVRWLGILPRAEVLRRYTEADCLLFPSKLETWGMPITEFKATGKPVLVADLPYAHETVGDYGKAAFFDTENVEELAEFMRKAILEEPVFQPSEQEHIAPPFSHNWEELWKILLTPAG